MGEFLRRISPPPGYITNMTDKQYRAWLATKLQNIAYVAHDAKRPASLMTLAKRLDALSKQLTAYAKATQPNH